MIDWIGNDWGLWFANRESEAKSLLVCYGVSENFWLKMWSFKEHFGWRRLLMTQLRRHIYSLWTGFQYVILLTRSPNYYRISCELHDRNCGDYITSSSQHISYWRNQVAKSFSTISFPFKNTKTPAFKAEKWININILVNISKQEMWKTKFKL